MQYIPAGIPDGAGNEGTELMSFDRHRVRSCGSGADPGYRDADRIRLLGHVVERQRGRWLRAVRRISPSHPSPQALDLPGRDRGGAIVPRRLGALRRRQADKTATRSALLSRLGIVLAAVWLVLFVAWAVDLARLANAAGGEDVRGARSANYGAIAAPRYGRSSLSIRNR